MYFCINNDTLPVKFESCGQFISDKSWKHTKRKLKSFEIILVLNGKLSISLDNELFEVQQDDILVIPPGTLHEGVENSEAGLKFLWCHFTINNFKNLENLSSKVKNSEFIILPQAGHSLGVHRLLILFNQLLDLSQSKVEKNYLNYYTTSLLFEISNQLRIQNRKKLNNGTDDMKVQPIKDWIRVHSDEKIGLREVAIKFNYNKSYLSRMFKEKGAVSLTELITRYRLEKAKILLKESEDSIHKISVAVGLDDPKYFMRIFKKNENMTPTEYRESFYKTHLNNK